MESWSFGKGIVVRKTHSAFIVMWYEGAALKSPQMSTISQSRTFPLRWKDTFGKSVSVLSLGSG